MILFYSPFESLERTCRLCHIEGSRYKYLIEYSFYCLSLQYGSNSFSGRARAPLGATARCFRGLQHLITSGLGLTHWVNGSGPARAGCRRGAATAGAFRVFDLHSFIHRRSSRRSSHTATSNTTRSVCVECRTLSSIHKHTIVAISL